MSHRWCKTDDGSIIDQAGRVIFFSTARFVQDICLGDCCFICGAGPHEKLFNAEHVLPRWLLQRYGLFDRTITLANEATYRYDRFTVPCCTECNARLGEEIEKPISEAVKDGAKGIERFVAANGFLKLYIWMGLIFLKTHLKDRDFRYHLDARLGDEKIADLHTWEELHHVHCMVRSFYNGAIVAPEAIGSILGVSVRQDASPELFDFADLSHAQTLFLRLGDHALFAVFNDGGASLQFFSQRLERITGPISEIQAREVLAELAFINLHLKERPVYQSRCDMRRERYEIIATHTPQPELVDLDHTVRGELMEHALRHALPKMTIPGHSAEEFLVGLRAGKCSFIFDDNGHFIEKTRLADGEPPSG